MGTEEKGTGARDELLTLAEVADYLRVSKRSVRRMIRLGSLPAYRIGGSGPYRFRNRDVDALLVPADRLVEEDVHSYITDQTEGRT